jgi:hypothetical protein
MTTKEKSKEDRLKDKYDDSSMKNNMKDQYGEEEGEKVYYATIRKQAMKKEEVVNEIAPALAVAGGLAAAGGVVGGALAGAGKVVGGAISGAGSIAKGSIKAVKKVKKGIEEPVEEGVIDVVKKGAKRHAKAIQAKKIKDRKAVPYAALAAEHEPEGELVEGDVHSGQGEKIQKRTLAWMQKKGQKGAPGLDAMKARAAEHKAKRGVKEEVVDEAKVDTGRSDYGKASIRNKRAFGIEGKPEATSGSKERGKMIDARRYRHKTKRGIKKGDYKIDEGNGYQPEIEHSKLGDATKKAKKEKESKLPPHLQGDAIGKMKKAFASTNKESFYNWRSELLGEEDYDKMKDARLVKYGIGHDGSDRKGPSSPPPKSKVKGKTVLQKETEKKYGKGVSAIDVVTAKIRDKYGKDAIMKPKK